MIQIEMKKKGVLGRSTVLGPVLLVVLDGFGYRREKDGNAIAHADMKMWKSLQKKYPHWLLKASGEAVGLPEGFMGNSEVGHLCIGAGRVVRTSFCKFHNSIEDQSFFKNKFLIDKLKKLKDENRSLHLMGLISDAGVHAHIDHLFALVKLAKQVGVKNVFIHAFLDGRDAPPKSAKKYLKIIDDFLEKERVGVIASLHGRFYAMDRNKNWDRTKKSYDLICGESEVVDNRSWSEVVDSFYEKNITDEFIEPTLLKKNGIVRQGDGVFFFNFRPDRAWQLTKMFLDLKKVSFFISTTRYKKEFENDVLFESEKISNTLLDVISRDEKHKVFIIAETEKYAHVTYFFRGKVDVVLKNEKRVLVPSLRVKNYVDHPEMSAPDITKRIVRSLGESPAYFYLVNYANCDMVGHSGDFGATVKACKCIDEQLKILYEEVVKKMNGTIFLVADHGNAEEMISAGSGAVKTSHTKNPVPFMVICKEIEGYYASFDEMNESPQYGLSDVSPMILNYLGLPIPEEMRG